VTSVNQLERELEDVIISAFPNRKLSLELAESLLNISKNTIWEDDSPPINIKEFILSSDYLNLDGIVFPGVLEAACDIINNDYEEAFLNWGIGSGKSFLSSILISYMVYRTLKLRDPQKFYNLAPDSLIAFMNMSVNATQAKKVVFGEIFNRIRSCKWIMDNFPPDPNVRSEIRFPKDIVVIPGNSKETFPLGYNLLGAVMDEGAWFTDSPNTERDVAEIMFNTLHKRITSRFGESEIPGLLVVISSPCFMGDFIERHMNQDQDKENIYLSRKSIWGVKPSKSNEVFFFDVDTLEIYEERPKDVSEYSERLSQLACTESYNRILEIPLIYKADFERNPIGALRDLGAIPSLSIEGYFRFIDKIKACIDINRYCPTDKNNNIKDNFKGDPNKIYFLHVDLALNHDACGVAMGHAESLSQGEIGRIKLEIDPSIEQSILEEPYKAVIDLMLQIKAPPGGEIIFSDIRKLILNLRNRGFRIHTVSFDGWQSIDSIQILNGMGFNTEVTSVDRNIYYYDTLKDIINTGRFSTYQYLVRDEFGNYDEILTTELQGLEFIKGKKVDHKYGGSKDVADAVAVVATKAIKVGPPAYISVRID